MTTTQPWNQHDNPPPEHENTPPPELDNTPPLEHDSTLPPEHENTPGTQHDVNPAPEPIRATPAPLADLVEHHVRRSARIPKPTFCWLCIRHYEV